MKKIFLFMNFIFLLTLTACNFYKNPNIEVPDAKEEKLTSPFIRNFSDYIVWDEVKNANSYEIYLDDKLILETDEHNYTIGEINNDKKVYVIAKNDNIKSEKSNILNIEKNISFSTNEILDLSGKTSYKKAISSEIRKIVISNKIELDLMILERNIDLVIELNDADIIGSIYTKDYIYNKSEMDYSVIFELNGDCYIESLNGNNGMDYSMSEYNNSATDGENGRNGYDSVVVPALIINGEGNLNITAGDGGNGGKGSATTTFEAVNGPGKGSNGGNGGSAIKTSTLLLDFIGEINYKNGNGGTKGKPGNNGSIITGPVASMMWNDVYDIGKDGNVGQSIINETIDLRI